MTTIINSNCICKEKDTFYLDTEEYQDNLGMKIYNSELVKFFYEDKKYTAKAVAVVGVKDLFILKNVEEIVN